MNDDTENISIFYCPECDRDFQNAYEHDIRTECPGELMLIPNNLSDDSSDDDSLELLSPSTLIDIIRINPIIYLHFLQTLRRDIENEVNSGRLSVERIREILNQENIDTVEAIFDLYFRTRYSTQTEALEKIQSIPLIDISQDDLNKNAGCVICMENFTISEKVKKLPCDHFYHETCITTWMERRHTCPYCRVSIFSENESLNSDETAETVNHLQSINNID